MTADSTSVPPTRILLMDVARLAGVSRTTASFVLTRRTDMGISASAAARVRQAARDLGYRPSLLARSLRTNASHTIGLLSDVLGGELFAGELIRGTQEAAVLHDKMIFVGETGGDPAVIADERAAGRSAVAALIEQGHRDGILVVSRAGSGAATGLRLRGINEVLRERGARVGAAVLTVRQPGQVAAAVGAALRAAVPPTALICLTDGIAMGAYQAAQECGISVPDDVAVISFGDSHLAPSVDPPITTVAVPYGELARQAVEILLAAQPTVGASYAPVQHVPMPVIERSSVAPAPQERASGAERSSA